MLWVRLYPWMSAWMAQLLLLVNSLCPKTLTHWGYWSMNNTGISHFILGARRGCITAATLYNIVSLSFPATLAPSMWIFEAAAGSIPSGFVFVSRHLKTEMPCLRPLRHCEGHTNILSPQTHTNAKTVNRGCIGIEVTTWLNISAVAFSSKTLDSHKLLNGRE